GGTGIPSQLTYITFTIPCNATEEVTRLRIHCGYISANILHTNGCAPTLLSHYGETEDYYIKIQKPGTVSADFVVPPAVYVNSPVTFTNANQRGYVSHEWDKGNNGTYNFTGTNYTTTFTSAG